MLVLAFIVTIRRARPRSRYCVARRRDRQRTTGRFPGTDYCGAGFRRRAIDGVILRRRVAGAALGSCAAAHARHAQASDGARRDQRNGDCGADAGAEAVHYRRRVAQRVRDRTRPDAFGDLRHAGAGRPDGPRGVAGSDRARDVARRRLRHPHDDDDRGDGRRNRDAVGFRISLDVLRRIRRARQER